MPEWPQPTGQPVVFLHIGPMKTGTTYLQAVMIANKRQLADAGILFPGDIWARQVRAVQDVLRLQRREPVVRQKAPGAWRRLVAEIEAHDGVSVVSMEFLSFARRRHVRRIMASLEFAEVHVVVTVRDAALVIPSLWQSDVRNGQRTSWPRFLRGVRKNAGWQSWLRRLPRDHSYHAFRDAQDIGRILRIWAAAVPATRLHVVTVPRPGGAPEVLWDRFATVVGAPPGSCPEPPAQDNASLGYESAELLRRVNVRLGHVQPSDYDTAMKDHLALKVLGRRAAVETRPRLDAKTSRIAADWNARVATHIAASGATVTGDLADLSTTVPADAPSGPSPEPETPVMLAAAADAVVGMQRLLRRRAGKLRAAGVEVAPLTVEKGVSAERWQAADDPIAAAVAEITDLAREAIRMGRRLRELDQTGSSISHPPQR